MLVIPSPITTFLIFSPWDSHDLSVTAPIPVIVSVPSSVSSQEAFSPHVPDVTSSADTFRPPKNNAVTTATTSAKGALQIFLLFIVILQKMRTKPIFLCIEEPPTRQ